MQFEQIPAELRALRQWTVWRPVLRDGLVTKPPYRADDPSISADVHDPRTWCSFDEAVAAYETHRSVLGGIGFMLTQSDPYVVIDVDRREKVPENMLGFRAAFEQQLLALESYTETSPSGAGMHVWLRAVMGVAGRHLQGVGSEAYAWQRFITCTGRPVSQTHAGAVVDGSAFIRMVGLADRPPEVELGDDPDRPTDQTDEQVLAAAYGFSSSFADRYEGRLACGPGEWSHTFVSLVGVLERLTGSVEQLRRLVYAAPMVTHGEPAGSGETRPAKARRTFADVLARVRGSNRSGNYFVDHGRRVYESIEAARVERAREAAARARRVVEESGHLSSKAGSLLDFFDGELRAGEHRLLTRPPGRTGEFVLACERASHAPFTKYAVPATLAALAGVAGRGYKTATGSGINLNFILAAPSSTGKTQSMDAWQRFENAVLSELPSTVSGPPRGRLLNASAASIQGIIKDFEEVPCCAWFIEECKSQLDSMSNCRTPVEAALRDSYNQLYDCSKHGHRFSPPRSVASRQANVQPIDNLSVSTYWTTTPAKLDVFTDDALDGFLSRVVIIRHAGPAGQITRDVSPLPEHLHAVLRDRMAEAQALDDLYRSSAGAPPNLPGGPGDRVTRVDDYAVRELDWALVGRCEVIKNAALRGDLPPAYTAASRLPQTAMRVASLMAVVENPYRPVVTEVQLLWSFGYVLQNLVSLLSDMDAGEVGQQASDDFAAVVRAYRVLSGRPEYRELPGVPRNDLFQHLKSYKAFADHPHGRSKAVTSTLAHMLAEGAIEEVVPSTGQRGRPTKYVVPVLENAVWR